MKCEKQTYSDWSYRSCNNNAKVCRDGKWYCGVHDPERLAEKRKVQSEKWDKEWAESRAKNKRRLAEEYYCQNLSVEYMETHIAKEGE